MFSLIELKDKEIKENFFIENKKDTKINKTNHLKETN